MLNSFVTLCIIFIYIGILYFIAISAEKKNWLNQAISSPPILALIMAIFATTWTYYGSVGMMAKTGPRFLAFYIGPIITFVFFNKLIEKIIRLKNEYKFTSIADFISTRYEKSHRVAGVVTILALLGMIPYISLQLKAVTDTFFIISDVQTTSITYSFIGFILSAIMIVFTIVFGVRKLDPSERHPGMMTAIAVESFLKLFFFLVCGIFITFFFFDGFNDIVNKIPDVYNSIATSSNSTSDETIIWISFMLISATAIIFLPRQFHVMVVENSSDKNFKSARWYFILYIILINIFVIPVAYAGIAKGLPIDDADNFLLMLPMLADNKILAVFIFLGGFSAATSMIMITSMTLSTMLSNHIVLPIIRSFEPLEVLKKELLKIRWLLVILIIFISYLFIFEVSEIESLIGIGVISFVAIFQLAPAGIGAIIWKKGTKAGAMTGMITGFLVWAYTLILPIFTGYYEVIDSIISTGPFGLDFLKPENLFNLNLPDKVSNSVFWTLVFNLTFFVVVSLLKKQSNEGKQLAERFGFESQIDEYLFNLKNLPATIRLESKISKIINVFKNYFSEPVAEEYLALCMANSGLDTKTNISIVELAKLHNESEKVLSGALGSAVASIELKEANIFEESEKRALEEVYANLLVDLKLPPEELLRKINYFQEKHSLQQEYSEKLEQKIKEREFEIEERKKIEAKLRRAEKNYRSIFENAVEGIFQSTFEGKLLHVNPSFAELLGYRNEKEIIEKNLNIGNDIYVNPKEREFFVTEIKLNGEYKNFETEIYKKDSSIIWVSVSGRLVEDSEKSIRFIEGTMIDISERKRTEQALILAKENAELADRLKSNFLAQMSHEIRTPINTILNFTSLLRMEFGSTATAEATECFHSIENGADRLLRTINLILNMSDLDAGTYTPNFVKSNLEKDIIQPLLKEFSHAAEIKNIKLLIQNDSSKEIEILLDPYTVTQIFANLIDNAIKYTNSGSITIKIYNQNLNTAIDVTDTGIGISEEYLPNMFNKFSQEEEGYTRKFEGNGLGLALVKKYCELNDASINVKSVKGKGTTFTLLFPPK